MPSIWFPYNRYINMTQWDDESAESDILGQNSLGTVAIL